ncbi:indolepyruvate oxidoreductase subunit beta [Candidatus Bathyarchaeota archaeon]|nr:indolepyruvate oxidoreductase subunit beta [Candidatus Bathyarchaeota archaeon]
MVKKSVDLIISGVGGQGVILLSTMIGRAAINEGLDVKIAETHGLAQRGGSVVSHVRIGRNIFSPLIPIGQADAVIGLEPLEAARYVSFIQPGSGVIIFNIKRVLPLPVRLGTESYPSIESLITILRKYSSCIYPIDADQIAEKVGNIRTSNIVMLGALAASLRLPFSIESLKAVVMRDAPKGTENANLLAFTLGVRVMKHLIAGRSL